MPRLTREEVLAARATPVGCCDRHADNMPCDCLSRAEGEEGAVPRVRLPVGYEYEQPPETVAYVVEYAVRTSSRGYREYFRSLDREAAQQSFDALVARLPRVYARLTEVRHRLLVQCVKGVR